MNFQELYADPSNKILIDILKNSLEDYCINTVIFAKTLNAEEFSDIVENAYNNIKSICLLFNIWNYVEVKMDEYRDFIWNKYKIIRLKKMMLLLILFYLKCLITFGIRFGSIGKQAEIINMMSIIGDYS